VRPIALSPCLAVLAGMFGQVSELQLRGRPVRFKSCQMTQARLFGLGVLWLTSIPPSPPPPQQMLEQ
jgi:hypothetical protein